MKKKSCDFPSGTEIYIIIVNNINIKFNNIHYYWFNLNCINLNILLKLLNKMLICTYNYEVKVISEYIIFLNQ